MWNQTGGVEVNSTDGTILSSLDMNGRVRRLTAASPGQTARVPYAAPGLFSVYPWCFARMSIPSHDWAPAPRPKRDRPRARWYRYFGDNPFAIHVEQHQRRSILVGCRSQDVGSASVSPDSDIDRLPWRIDLGGQASVPEINEGHASRSRIRDNRLGSSWGGGYVVYT